MNCCSVQHQHIVRKQLANNNCQLTHYCKIYSVVAALSYTLPHWRSPVLNTTESNYGGCVSDVSVCQDWRDFSREHSASSLSTKKLRALHMLLVSKLDAGAIEDGEHEEIFHSAISILRSTLAVWY